MGVHKDIVHSCFIPVEGNKPALTDTCIYNYHRYDVYISDKYTYAVKEQGEWTISHKKEALEVVQKEIERLEKELVELTKIQSQIMKHE